jgi:large subunit ribosomal protein L23
MTGIFNFDKIFGLVYTEKTNKQIADNAKYCFKISKTATKKEVASLIKKLYNVTVKKVNIINTPEKTKRFKGIESKAGSYKKAVITLEKGQTINFGS